MDFKGQVVLVTGGANGIGRATAVQFARHGAKVMIVDRDEQGCAETVKLIGDAAQFKTADVSKRSDVQSYVGHTLSAFGAIDCFFNNAGIEGRVAPIYEENEANFDAVIAVNLKGVFLGMREVLPVMIKQKRGTVVNTSSIGGLRGAPGMAAYIASKHAVLGLTKVAAADVAQHGIRVNAVCPGPVETRMMDSLEQQRQAITGSNKPISRAGYSTADDIAGLVLFLCSNYAGNVTGAHFTSDGGGTAHTGAQRLVR